jgi:CheY-like chemotaxis protein
VLYIEDNFSNLQLIERVLERRPGIELLSARQGNLGLEMAMSRRPDLVLLDLHLPGIPGWEVLASLQANPSLRDIPVVVISADATTRQIEKLMNAGARAYLTKPIDVSELLRVLDEHLGSGRNSLPTVLVG